MSDSSTNIPQEISGGETGFVRKSSGLVRDWSSVDAWRYNLIAMNVVFLMALTWVFIPAVYPQASMWLCVVISGIFATVEGLVYALLLVLMPRSGGDYVFQSRVFGGALATVFSFTLIFTVGPIYMALAGFLASQVIFSPFLTLIGQQYDWTWAVEAGTWFGGKDAIFILGVLSTIWGCFLTVKGMRFYAMIQRWLFLVALVTLGVVIAGFLFSSHQDFVNNLNEFMLKTNGVHNGYQAVLDAAGPIDTSFSFGATMLACAIASFSLITPAWCVQNGGEIRGARSLSTTVRLIVASVGFQWIVMAIIAVLLTSVVGSQFLSASGQLYNSGSPDNPLTIAPFFGFFAAIVVQSPIFLWISFVMFLSWFILYPVPIVLPASRVLMAMSFDRILPEWLGRVNPKSHAPVNGTLLFAIPCIAASAMYAYAEWFYSLTLGLTMILAIGILLTMLAAVVMPFRQRQLFEASPIGKLRIGPIPLISVLGTIAFGWLLYLTIQYLIRDELGINGTRGLIFVGSLFGFAALVYFLAWITRKQEGIELSQIAKELPVE